jgi:hypothetical protein
MRGVEVGAGVFGVAVSPRRWSDGVVDASRLPSVAGVAIAATLLRDTYWPCTTRTPQIPTGRDIIDNSPPRPKRPIRVRPF